MKITVYKAQPHFKEHVIPDLCIMATTDFPETDDLHRSRILHDIDAKDLVNALFETLPGGTLDAILIHMLDRNRSLLKVKV